MKKFLALLLAALTIMSVSAFGLAEKPVSTSTNWASRANRRSAS